ILGEYDAPERQEQGLVLYDFLKDGNTIIYGNDGAEREMLLNTLIYSSIKNHGADELNYYIIDYGSESLRKYKSLLHVGGIVFAGEDEKFYNLLKLIKEEITKRKKLFSDFGGDYFNYIQLNKELLPIKVIIINNYDSVYENYPE
ncbi:MAG: FtsK/SpoIIIE domain-containing protein, partial [Bacilli bacterium]|nr:FtsK/SpoIIIE domain-containing protein [Bacilli bacterium]